MPINKHSEKSKAVDSSRRSLLVKLWAGLGMLAVLQTAGVVVAYLRPHKPSQKNDASQSVVNAGPVESFPVGSVTAFISGKFYLARLNDGGFLALSRKCTHLGCTVLWLSRESKFVCPCHSSEFNMQGEVLDPPAPRALDRYMVSIENDIVKINLNKRIKLSSFDYSHVAYPEES